MQVREKKFTVKSIIENTDNKNIVYDHPLQRKPGQWDREQKSLLIHSIEIGYAIPQIYALQLWDNFDDAFTLLDGMQRLTTVYDYVHDKFCLSKNMPLVTLRRRETITDEEGNRHAEFVNKEYDISNKKYSELDEKLKERIMDFQFSVILLSDCTDEDIENQFYRLNNGTPLTKDQKARVILGDELAAFIDTQENKEFFVDKSYFNNNQRKQGAVQTCILQTLMLVMDYPYRDLGNNSVIDFAKWFRLNHKESDLEYCSDLFDKLNEAIPESEVPYRLLKKINIPIVAYHVQTADEIGMDIKSYGDCILAFFDAYSPECEYAGYCGTGAYKKDKVKARMDYLEIYVRGWRK